LKTMITGAGGQLGRSLTQLLEGADVVSLDRAALDIGDLEAVRGAIKEVRPEIVINAAAYNRVDDAEHDPGPAFRGNAVGPRNLALATAEASIPIVHVSTDYVFDGRGTRPYHEFDNPAPLSVYGASKLAGENAVRDANRRHYIVRTAWVYHESAGNFPRTMLSLADRDEVRVVTDQVGSPTYAPHLARGVLHLAKTDAFGTYHLAGSGEASWYDLTCELYRHLGIRTPVIPVTTQEFPRPAERPRYSALASIQEPTIELPPWSEGLAEFCSKVQLAP
jgi:dTDP-4-dehydrorhamnose reductase